MEILQKGYWIWILIVAMFVAINGAYIALIGVQKGRNAIGLKKIMWKLFAGSILAIGGWTTHFVALLSFRSHVHASYDLWHVLLTLLLTAICIITSLFLFHQNKPMRFYSSVMIMTVGWMVVHFFGMLSLKGRLPVSYNIPMFLFSLVLAFSFSYIQLAWARREQFHNDLSHPSTMRKAIEIGLSIIVFHTIAMFADSSVPWIDLFSVNHELPVHTDSLVIYLVGATLVLFLGSFLYILSENSKARTRAQISQIKYQSLFFENTEGVLSFTNRGELLEMNQAASNLLGYTVHELKRNPWRQFVAPEHLKQVECHLQECLNGESVDYEIELLTKDGEKRIVLMKHVPMIWNGHVQGSFSLFQDLTKKKKAQEELLLAKKQLEQLAFYDSLTGVANRRLFEQMMDNLTQTDQVFALFYLDFDRFKWINDHFSHEAGDEFLKEVAERLRRLLPKKGSIARLGGDEFAVILRETNEEEAKELAELMVQQFREPFFYQEQLIQTSASIGAALYPRDGLASAELIRNADHALYYVKRNGRNGYHFHLSAENREIQIQNMLPYALEKGQLYLAYQPKIHLSTHEVMGVEALLRWKHPLLGDVSPADFIPFAEEHGFIYDITLWVLETACAQVKKWEEKGYSLKIAVNLSAAVFRQGDFLEQVMNTLQKFKVSPHCLIVEVTETAYIESMERAQGILGKMRKFGIGIAVDDFGTGLSSLAYLQCLPVSLLKIDASFVRNVHEQRKNELILQNIIRLAKTLRIQVLAEGVESAKQAELLRGMGCDFAQGFYFGRPLEAEELELWLLENPVPQKA